MLLTPFELVAKAEQTLGPITWRGPFDTSTDPEYVRWQAGEITEREYWLIRGAPYGLELHELMSHFYEPAGDYLVRPEMADLVRRHRAMGRVVGVLTNDMNAFHGPEWKSGISVIKEFDFIVDGSITGFLKPDPRAFRIALEALGDPDPCRWCSSTISGATCAAPKPSASRRCTSTPPIHPLPSSGSKPPWPSRGHFSNVTVTVRSSVPRTTVSVSVSLLPKALCNASIDTSGVSPAATSRSPSAMPALSAGPSVSTPRTSRPSRGVRPTDARSFAATSGGARAMPRRGRTTDLPAARSSIVDRSAASIGRAT